MEWKTKCEQLIDQKSFHTPNTVTSNFDGKLFIFVDKDGSSKKKIQQVIILRNEGKSLRKIAEIVKQSPFTVQCIMSNYKMTKSINSRPHSGCPKKVKWVHQRGMLNTDRGETKTSVPKLSDILKSDYNLCAVPYCQNNKKSWV